ncbi:hypothetical protein Tdes44962_MAKER03027 [Teratosphaeria destructans]|uniref:Uncharacterized protein n=1 Tax=Teratosphaeria destructans TaxID=418781 RepID=A0A9W7SRH7_9PEZI|nr:hypothetical protein Tdes44962_MAKER03027 [Teratosphaeria destructans]
MQANEGNWLAAFRKRHRTLFSKAHELVDLSPDDIAVYVAVKKKGRNGLFYWNSDPEGDGWPPRREDLEGYKYMSADVMQTERERSARGPRRVHRRQFGTPPDPEGSMDLAEDPRSDDEQESGCERGRLDVSDQKKMPFAKADNAMALLSRARLAVLETQCFAITQRLDGILAQTFHSASLQTPLWTAESWMTFQEEAPKMQDYGSVLLEHWLEDLPDVEEHWYDEFLKDEVSGVTREAGQDILVKTKA